MEGQEGRDWLSAGNELVAAWCCWQALEGTPCFPAFLPDWSRQQATLACAPAPFKPPFTSQSFLFFLSPLQCNCEQEYGGHDSFCPAKPGRQAPHYLSKEEAQKLAAEQGFHAEEAWATASSSARKGKGKEKH